MKTDRQKLVRSIAKDLSLRNDVVEDVLNRLTDIAIEDIVNNGEFSIKNFFSINSSKWKSYKLNGKEIKSHFRLKVRISRKLKELYHNFGKNSENYGLLNRNNWKDLANIDDDNDDIEDTEIINPMLFDDED